MRPSPRTCGIIGTTVWPGGVAESLFCEVKEGLNSRGISFMPAEELRYEKLSEEIFCKNGVLISQIGSDHYSLAPAFSKVAQ
jgi:hypothetical protein